MEHSIYFLIQFPNNDVLSKAAVKPIKDKPKVMGLFGWDM